MMTHDSGLLFWATLYYDKIVIENQNKKKIKIE